jgi:hypothetical protein
MIEERADNLGNSADFTAQPLVVVAREQAMGSAAEQTVGFDPQQGTWPQQVVRGFFAYHAVPTNWEALKAFRYYVERIWLPSCGGAVRNIA